MKPIETERLYLRLFTKNDAEKVAEMCNDYNLYKTTLSLPYPYTVECAYEWIKHHEKNFTDDICYEFAITDKLSGELYGSIGLINCSKQDSNGEMGYWIGRKYWSRGYATEAARALVRFAFEERGFHRIFARHFASNPASGRVMQKAGMVYEGTQKEQIYKIDKYEDAVLYGIINSEN